MQGMVYLSVGLQKKSDNANYFTIRPREGIVSRVARAFHESPSKSRHSSSTSSRNDKTITKRSNKLFDSPERELSNKKKRLKHNDVSWKDIENEFSDIKTHKRVVLLQPERSRANVSSK